MHSRFARSMAWPLAGNLNLAPDPDRRGVSEAPPSLAPLYHRHSKRVYGVALAILRSREEAEDVTQEVFATLCGSSAYEPNRGSIGAFLVTMARSRAIDRLRCRRRSTRLLKSWWAEAPPTEVATTTPCERISMRRTAERVREAIAKLPCAQRQILEMAYYRDLTQREIAAELDTPLGTVKTWSRRALIALGNLLNEHPA